MRQLSTRPLSIRLFCASFMLSALIAFGDALGSWQEIMSTMADRVPGSAWSRDAVIVLACARLSIALIPVLLVWFFASNFARWMVTVLALGKLLNIPEAIEIVRSGGGVDWLWSASLALALFAAGLLFTPASREWFKAKGEDLVAPTR